MLTRQRKIWDVRTLVGRRREKTLISPKFQRGNIWNRTKKSEAIYSLLTIGLPEITLLETKEGTYHILDGLQRVNAIVDFLAGKFKIKLDPSVDHIDEELVRILEGKTFRELPKEIQNKLLNAEVALIIYGGIDSFEVAKSIFTRLNYKPTPLKEGELLFALTYDEVKSPLLEERGEQISKRRKTGFTLLVRGLVSRNLAEDVVEGKEVEEEFKFERFYDWLFRQTIRLFENSTEGLLRKRADDLLLLYKGMKKEAGLDPKKATYWWEFLGFTLLEAESKEIPIEDYASEILPERVREVSENSEWRKNVSQRNRQKPKVLKERFLILGRIFRPYLARVADKS